MKLSTKGRYAMIALTDLANAGADELVSLSEISERQDISLAYLEQLFVKLRRAGIVESVSGAKAGTPAQMLTDKLWEQLSAHVYVFLHQTRLCDISGDAMAPCAAVPSFIDVVDEDCGPDTCGCEEK